MSGDESDGKSKGGGKSPPKTPSSKAPLARLTGSGSGEIRVVERVVREEPGASMMLTRTNYMEWALVMQVKLQVARVWSAVTDEAADEDADRRALQIILTGVPPEMLRVLAAKDTAKTAWETIRTMRMGSERAREAKAQVRRREFEDLRFKDGESVEDFGLRLAALVADLELYGDPVTEHKAVQKFLRVVPRKFRPMAMAIESLIDLKTMSIEELVGRFSACEDHYDLDDATQSTGRLMLTHEEWMAREKHGGGSGSSSSAGSGKNKSPAKPKGAGGGKPASGYQGAGGSGGSGGRKKKGKCHHCGIPGHWKKECRTWLREQEQKGTQEQANLVQGGAEHDPGLYMAVVTTVSTPQIAAPQEVFLNEEKVMPVPSPDGVWYFDTGASSHMTGDRGVFASLDETVHGTVKFGDGSVVAIQGRGSVVFRCQGGGQRVLTGVFHIPSLCTNIVSVGQLDEAGCVVNIQEGVMTIQDPGRRTLAHIRRSGNRLYTGALEIDKPRCLLALGDDVTWRWHARMGHLHFRALRAMSSSRWCGACQ